MHALPILVALALHAAPPRGYDLDAALDVPYVRDAGPRQRLDVFSPRSKGERFPVVVFVHGGTWMFGDKDDGGLNRDAGRNFARNGAVAVLPNYRLSPYVRHPAHARDVAAAYAWAVRNAARYGGDPTRVVLVGHSAGGHLAALVAADPTYLKDAGLSDEQRRSLRAVVCLGGVYRMPRDDEYARMSDALVRGLVGDEGGSRFAKFASPLLRRLGDGLNPFPWVFGDDPAARRKAEPLANVREGMPPHLIVTAAWEVPGLRDMADEYAAALTKARCDVTSRGLDGRHSSFPRELHRNDRQACAVVSAFVHKHAGGPEKRP